MFSFLMRTRGQVPVSDIMCEDTRVAACCIVLQFTTICCNMRTLKRTRGHVYIPDIMRKYNELFSFLLRVKRAKTELQQVCACVCMCVCVRACMCSPNTLAHSRKLKERDSHSRPCTHAHSYCRSVGLCDACLCDARSCDARLFSLFDAYSHSLSLALFSFTLSSSPLLARLKLCGILYLV